MRCRLLFLWFGGSQVFMQLTAIYVCCNLFLEASRRKGRGQLCIRIYHLFSLQFCTGKKFPFPNLRKNLPSIQTTSMKASRPRVLLKRLLKHISYGRSSAPQPHILTQDELKVLVRNLEQSKSKEELLGSRLKQWNLLEKKRPNFFVSQSSSAAGAFLQKGR